MPYAFEGGVRQDFAAGCIEISDVDYLAAIEGLVSGKVVSVVGGFTIREDVKDDTVPSEPELPNDPSIIAQAELAQRRAEADYAIAPLQDAVDINDATEADLALLTAWKTYRVALSRVPDQAAYPATIEWPATPV